MRRLVQAWWPVPSMLAVIIAAQVAWTSRYEVPDGHASDHFMSATAIFGLTAATSILLWALPRSERRQPVLWLLAAAVLASALAITVANVRVVDAIGGNNWTDEQADALGPALAGFTSGHDLAEKAGWAITVAAVLLAGWLGLRRAVHRGAALVAGAASLIVGLGVFVLAIAALVERARRQPRSDDRGVD